MNYFRFLCIGVFVFTSAHAQDASIAAPVLGFIPDARSASLRPVFGIPGASMIGDPLELPWPAAQALASPDGHVLVLAGDGSGVWIVFEKRVRRIPGLSTQPSSIALSPSGTAAALCSKEDNLIEIVTGLPDQPVVDRRIDRQAFPGDTLAISDDGSWLLAAASDGVYLSNSTGQVERVGETARSLAFRPRSHEFAITVSDELVVWRSSNASYQRQWSRSDGVYSAVAARFSNDSHLLWIANADGGLLALDRNGEKETGFCHCRPEGLQPMAGGAVALTGFSSLSNAPMQLATSGATGLKVFFVPAAGPLGEDQSGDHNR